MKHKSRRRRLVEKGGVEMFEFRVSHWFDVDGNRYISHEVTDPDGPVEVPLHEVLGTMLIAALEMWADSRDDDE